MKNAIQLIIEYEDARKKVVEVKKLRADARGKCVDLDLNNYEDCIQASINVPDRDHSFEIWEYLENSELCENCRKWVDLKKDKDAAVKRFSSQKKKLSYYGKIFKLKTQGE